VVELDMQSQDKPRPSPGKTVLMPNGADGFSGEVWATIGEAFRLSERELAILKLVFDDKCDTEIAQELSMSRHTVHTHFGRLYRKMGVHSRIQLVIAVFWQYERMQSDSSEKEPLSPT
jgi:DNA-binding NarL/FixJ family response regulator